MPLTGSASSPATYVSLSASYDAPAGGTMADIETTAAPRPKRSLTASHIGLSPAGQMING